MPCDEVPKVYRVNHVKRLCTGARNGAFEGQLPKLRYYHTVKKVELPEVNNNDAKSVKSQPITASSKKNGSSGQMKITGKNRRPSRAPGADTLFIFLPQISSKRRNDSR